MDHWFCYSVLSVEQNQRTIETLTTPRVLVENIGCGIMSVFHTQNKACLRTLSIAQLVQYYLVFSVGLGLGYRTLIQCTVHCTGRLLLLAPTPCTRKLTQNSEPSIPYIIYNIPVVVLRLPSSVPS